MPIARNNFVPTGPGHAALEVETLAVLPELDAIPISYTVRSVLKLARIDHGLGGYTFSEQPVEPYEKDYDVDAGQGPSRWAERFGVANWGVIGAWIGPQRVGSAVIAVRTPELDMLEGRDDLAVLWDLRVQPAHRRSGIGAALFRASEDWAKRQGCRTLKVETQNVNPDACRFYVSRGCELGGINEFAYPGLPDEVQLLWYKELR